MEIHISSNTEKRVVLIISVFSAFLTPFMGSAMNIALPEIGKEFSGNAVLLGWIATAFMLTAAMFLVPFGKIADIYGRKKIFIYGVSIYTLLSLLSAFAPNVPLLILFRLIQGIGAAMIFGTGMAILTSVYPVQERGKVLGISVSATYLGLSLGPVLGGFLTHYLGWRSIFWTNVPVGIFILILGITGIKGEWADAKDDKLDWTGSAVYGISLAILMYGFSRIPALSGYALTGIGLAGILLFFIIETKAAFPVLDIKFLLKNRPFAFSNLAALINYSATSALTFLLSLYLQYVKGLNPQTAGLILFAQPVMMAVFSPLSGHLSDRIEPGIIASSGMGLSAFGLILFVFLKESTPNWLIFINLMLIGLGFALFSSPNTNAVMSSVERRFYGTASATLGTMRLIGQMFSMGISLMILSLFMGKAGINPSTFGLFMLSSKTAFIVFSALCVGGIFASLVRGKVRKINPSAG